MTLMQKRIILLVTIFVLYIGAMIAIWVIPNIQMNIQIICSYAITLTILLGFFWILSNLNWKYKEKGFVLNGHLPVWNKLKDKYLSLSFVTSLIQVLFYALVMTYFIMSITTKQEYETIWEYLSSSPAIVLILGFVTMIPFIVLTIINRIIMFKIFLTPHFDKEANLTKNTWFFQNKFKTYIFISLHFTVPGVGMFLAITMYKDISDNNRESIEQDQTLIQRD